MSFPTLLIVLGMIGLLSWAITTLIPMPEGVRKVIIVVAIICAVLYALMAFGVHLPNPNVPRMN